MRKASCRNCRKASSSIESFSIRRASLVFPSLSHVVWRIGQTVSAFSPSINSVVAVLSPGRGETGGDKDGDFFESEFICGLVARMADDDNAISV
jgi:hypothetical protein